VSWYYPKGWTDQEDGIEQVLIHYVCTPPGQWPDWSWGHESRVLEDRGGFPRTRLKVLRMPREVWDMDNGWNAPEYRFHYFFEVFQDGHRWTTDRFTEDIVYRDLEYVDDHAWTTNICIYWSVGDWAAPVYSPMEDPRFPGQGAVPPRQVPHAAGTGTAAPLALAHAGPARRDARAAVPRRPDVPAPGEGRVLAGPGRSFRAGW
jgi:hypothetical protein